MHIIAAISQKGGSGKTTLAVNLAVAADLAGHAAIVVDLDPQGSAALWGEIRQARLPVVVPARAGDLEDVLERAADLVVIPCRPSIFDLHSVETSFRLAKLAGTYATGLLWATRQSRRSGAAASGRSGTPQASARPMRMRPRPGRACRNSHPIRRLRARSRSFIGSCIARSQQKDPKGRHRHDRRQDDARRRLFAAGGRDPGCCLPRSRKSVTGGLRAAGGARGWWCIWTRPATASCARWRWTWTARPSRCV